MVHYRIESPTGTIDNLRFQLVEGHREYHSDILSNPCKVLRGAQALFQHGRSMSAPTDVPNTPLGSEFVTTRMRPSVAPDRRVFVFGSSFLARQIARGRCGSKRAAA